MTHKLIVREREHEGDNTVERISMTFQWEKLKEFGNTKNSWNYPPTQVLTDLTLVKSNWMD